MMDRFAAQYVANVVMTAQSQLHGLVSRAEAISERPRSARRRHVRNPSYAHHFLNLSKPTIANVRSWPVG